MNKISVIVPIYNVEKYISKCIISLLNQTLKNIEILLINDGSTDSSKKIIMEFQEKYPNKIKVINKNNEGVSVARNLGIIKSSAQYIAFVDADDWLHQEMLELMYKKAIENKSDLVLCNARVIDEKEGSLRSIWKSGNLNRSVENIYDNKELINTILPAPWGKLFKKSLFIDNDIFFPLYLRNQDLGTIPRILIHCKSISKVDEALYNYLYRDCSAMRTYDNKILDVVKNLYIVDDYYQNRGIHKEFVKELEYLFIEHLLFRAVYRIKLVVDTGVKEELIDHIIFSLKERYPKWHKNTKIKNLNIKKRVYLYLVNIGQIKKVMVLFNIKKRMESK
ncbi:MAG: glycosyltransferase [Eubacteriaceae bacterium]